MVNWDYLQNNLTELTINTSSISDPYELTSNIVSTADSTSDGYLGLAIMIMIFLVLTFTIYRDDQDIRLDIVRSVMLSSGFTSIVGVIMLVSNITSSFTHVMWFISIFMISILSLIFLKKKNL